jgi:hypothetical protein
MSRANLVQSYIDALPGTIVSIVSSPDGQRSRFETGAVDAGATVYARLHFKDSHADLVLSFCGVSDWSDMPPAALLESISTTAQGLGARPRSDADITAAANDAVDHVVAKVEGMRQNGGLAVVNAGYKRYRLGQVAKGEKAVSYAVHLAKFTQSLVAEVAKFAR